MSFIVWFRLVIACLVIAATATYPTPFGWLAAFMCVSGCVGSLALDYKTGKIEREKDKP